jgi:hypothetical protein
MVSINCSKISINVGKFIEWIIAKQSINLKKYIKYINYIFKHLLMRANSH